MLRTIVEGVFLFLLPWAAFAAYLLIVGQNPLHPEVWSRKALSWLTIAALVLCIAGVIAVGGARRLENGTFVPSHVAPDGRFVPGGFQPRP
jgi:Family of unknown function (DUF6111)